MNPLIKAVGTVLALAAGTLGASLESLPVDPFGGPRVSNGSSGGGNETGNATAGNGTAGNATSQGNATGNSTGNATGNSTAGNGTAPDGNQTGNATGNQTGNQTTDPGNETAEPDASPPAPQSAACSFHLSESGRDPTPRHHEWEWRVTPDVRHLRVSFSSGAGVPVGLGGGPEVRLIDGLGRIVADGSSSNAWLEVHLERGADPLADGVWRLVYDGTEAFADYRVKVSLGCDP